MNLAITFSDVFIVSRAMLIIGGPIIILMSIVRYFILRSQVGKLDSSKLLKGSVMEVSPGNDKTVKFSYYDVGFGINKEIELKCTQEEKSTLYRGQEISLYRHKNNKIYLEEYNMKAVHRDMAKELASALGAIVLIIVAVIVYSL